MPTIAETFHTFLNNIEPTEAERQNISKQQAELRDMISRHLGGVVRYFPSGSYARRTAIRPLNDVDIFLVLDSTAHADVYPSAFNQLSPQPCLEKLQRVLSAAYPSKVDAPRIQGRSIHVDFSDTGIGHDIVPAFSVTGDMYMIPDRSRRIWISSNPEVHRQTLVAANERAGSKLNPLIKAVKCWNRAHDRPLRSFHLEVMSYGAFQSPPRTYAEGMRDLFNHLATAVLRACREPAGVGPNVDLGMPPQERQKIELRLKDAAAKVGKAIELDAAKRTDEAHAIFRELLGPDYPVRDRQYQVNEEPKVSMNKKKLLFLAANPSDTAPLRFDREMRKISEALGGAVELVHVLAARTSDLQDALIKHQPAIVHFAGHGAGNGNIVLENEHGRAVLVDKAALAETFHIFGKNCVQAVVLNACFTHEVAEAIAQHIPYAVGTSQAVADEEAFAFAVAFYKGIAAGDTVDRAFERGRNQLRLDNINPDLACIFTRKDAPPTTLTILPKVTEVATPSKPTSDAVRILLHLDLASDNFIPNNELLSLLGEGTTPEILTLTEEGIPRKPYGNVEDYAACADAIHRMVAKARARTQPGRATQYFVAGRAVLPAFVLLGMEMSSWADVTVLNQRKEGGFWDVIHPDKPVAAKDREPFFEIREGIHASEASGRVAIFIGIGHVPSRDKLRSFIEERSEHVAGIVEVRTERNALLDATNAAQVMGELRDAFMKVTSAYPHRNGIALFIAGPATLAFLIGRAINPRVVGDDIWATNYDGSTYHFAYRLPWTPPTRQPIDLSATSELARERILFAIRDKVFELKRNLKKEHLPPSLGADEADRFLERLNEIEVASKPEGDEFQISVSERTLSLGKGLLEALRSVESEDERARIGQALVLHELFHDDQNIVSSTFQAAGRAGFALEEVDFWADAVALGTLCSMAILRGGENARENPNKIVEMYVDAILRGIEAFDRFDNATRIDRLSERRLRRYLIWHLQRARALTLRRHEDLWTMLGQRLVVELAPLRGHLDPRWDKIVDGANRDTELFVVLQGRLLRIPAQGSFDPEKILLAIRTFDRATVSRAMTFVRDRHRSVLAPWGR